MRPAGEVRAALLAAVRELQTDQQGPTLREAALHAQVGLQVAENTFRNLRRGGHVRIVRRRAVAYRTAPVGEYALPQAGTEAATGCDLGEALSAWMGQR